MTAVLYRLHTPYTDEDGDTGAEWFKSLKDAVAVRAQYLDGLDGLGELLTSRLWSIDKVTLTPMGRQAQLLSILNGRDFVQSTKEVVPAYVPPIGIQWTDDTGETHTYGFSSETEAADWLHDAGAGAGGPLGLDDLIARFNETTTNRISLVRTQTVVPTDAAEQ